MPDTDEHPRFQYDLEHCPLKRALDVVGEKWALLILREAFYGLTRFDDFARALACGRAVLSARLKTLVAEDVMAQKAYTVDGHRPRAGYVLTEKGRDLYTTLLALSQWSERWMPPPDGPVSVVTEKGTGRAVRAVITSDSRVKALVRRDLDVVAGPGAVHTPPGA